MKRWFFLLIVINVAIFVPMIWWRRSGADAGSTHRVPPVKTDMSQAEVQDAISVIDQERLMWSQFTNLSAHLDVAWGTGEVLAGDVSLRQIGPPDRPWEFEMSFSNKDQGWALTTDSTHGNTQLHCRDNITALWLTNTGPTMLVFMTFPKQLLLTLYYDQNLPYGRVNRDELIHMFSINHNPQAQGTPHSYTWRKLESDFKIDGISFRKGRLSEWHIPRRSESIEFDESGRETNRFCYPSSIHFQLGTNECTMRFSNIAMTTLTSHQPDKQAGD
jgi:hypothetical protein